MLFTVTFNFSTVLLLPAQPQYSPKKIQVAIIGQPFDFDFNFTGSTVPTLVTWRKNGRIFRGDGERVILDHTGIVFTRVLNHDAGQYQVDARSSDGRAHGYSLLKGSVMFNLDPPLNWFSPGTNFSEIFGPTLKNLFPPKAS